MEATRRNWQALKPLAHAGIGILAGVGLAELVDWREPGTVDAMQIHLRDALAGALGYAVGSALYNRSIRSKSSNDSSE